MGCLPSAVKRSARAAFGLLGLLLCGSRCGPAEALAPDGGNFCAVTMAGYAPPPSRFPMGGDATPSFRDATAAWGLPLDLHSLTASIGDLNRDGNLDLLVWEKSGAGIKEAYLGCGGRFVPLGLAGRIDGAPVDLLHQGAVASAIRDIDGDGRPDLLVGTLDNQVRVLRQEAGLRFSHRAWTPPPDDPKKPHPRISIIAPVDIDGDGRLDLYVAYRDTKSLAMGMKGEQQGGTPDRVLLQRPDGSFADAAGTPDYAPIFECGNQFTYGVLFFAEARPGSARKRYLWLGSINTDSCLFEYTLDSGRPAWNQRKLPVTGLSPRTMGLEYAYEDDSGAPVVTESNSHMTAPTFRVTDREITDLTASVDFTPYPPRAEDLLAWGSARRDFDNDGGEDLVLANGAHLDPVLQEMFFGGLAVEGHGAQYLQIYRNDGTDKLHNASAAAGAEFNTPAGWYTLAVGDFDRDGCYDLVAGPKDLAKDVGEYDIDEWPTGVRLLLNSCSYPNDRLGLVLPDRAALVTVEGTRSVNGTARPFTKYRGVKDSPGVGSGSDRAYLIVGVGRGATVGRVTVTADKGGRFESFAVDGKALKMNAYNDVSAPK